MVIRYTGYESKDACSAFFKDICGRCDRKKCSIDVAIMQGVQRDTKKAPSVLMVITNFTSRKTKEDHVRPIWVVTTTDMPALDVICRIIKSGWDIENTAFHELKDFYYIGHCFCHETAQVIFWFQMLAFNCRQAYLLINRYRDFHRSKSGFAKTLELMEDSCKYKVSETETRSKTGTRPTYDPTIINKVHWKRIGHFYSPFSDLWFCSFLYPIFQTPSKSQICYWPNLWVKRATNREDVQASDSAW